MSQRRWRWETNPCSAKGAANHQQPGATPQGPESNKSMSTESAIHLGAIVAMVNTCFRAFTHERQETNLCHLPDRRSGREPAARARLRARRLPGPRGAAEEADWRESEARD